MDRISINAIAVAALAALATSFNSSPARADVEYAWCAVYKSDLGTNCGFVSMEQCLAAIYGIGGFCYPNPAYPGPAAAAAPPQSPRESNR